MKPRLKQIVTMLGSGMCIKEIASALGISAKTVEFHWANAKRLLGFESYVDAAHYALVHGWIRNEFNMNDECRESVNDV